MNRKKLSLSRLLRLLRNYIIPTVVIAAVILSSGISETVFGLSSITEIYINGCLLKSDTVPVIKNDSTFVPLRVIGEALGYQLDYSGGTITLQHSESGTNISLNIGDRIANVNGKLVEMPAEAFLENDRTMVPVRFLSEALSCQVEWSPGYESSEYPEYSFANEVIIYSPYPVSILDGKVQVSYQREKQEWELEGGFDGKSIIGYDLVIPVLTISGNEALARTVNEKLTNFSNATKDSILQSYDEILAVEADYRYSSTDECSFKIMENNGVALTVIITGYWYGGGAHGTPYWNNYNIDVERGKLLNLSDLFKVGADYESVLLDEMNALRRTSPVEYEGVSDPYLQENQDFYIKDGNLVLYYHPYDLSSYARGFVEFSIPLKKLAGQLKDEYLW